MGGKVTKALKLLEIQPGSPSCIDLEDGEAIWRHYDKGFKMELSIEELSYLVQDHCTAKVYSLSLEGVVFGLPASLSFCALLRYQERRQCTVVQGTPVKSDDQLRAEMEKWLRYFNCEVGSAVILGSAVSPSLCLCPKSYCLTVAEWRAHAQKVPGRYGTRGAGRLAALASGRHHGPHTNGGIPFFLLKITPSAHWLFCILYLSLIAAVLAVQTWRLKNKRAPRISGQLKIKKPHANFEGAPLSLSVLAAVKHKMIIS